jgi:hypothetical protein
MAAKKAFWDKKNPNYTKPGMRKAYLRKLSWLKVEPGNGLPVRHSYCVQ